MRAADLKLPQPEISFILFINGKAISTYEDKISAKWAMQEMQKIHPDWQYEIRKEICQVEPTAQELTEKWSQKYKRSINCNNPRGFSQRAHCQGRKKKQVDETLNKNNFEKFKEEFKTFLSFIKSQLSLESLPKIKILYKVQDTTQPTFGRFNSETQTLEVGILNRQFMDIFRTTAHEIVHYKQNLESKGQHISGNTGSDDENEANAVAGIIMREYGKLRPDLYQQKPLVDESIIKVGSRYRLVSKKTGRNLGTFDTKSQAKKREQQVQYFKHKG